MGNHWGWPLFIGLCALWWALACVAFKESLATTSVFAAWGIGHLVVACKRYKGVTDGKSRGN